MAVRRVGRGASRRERLALVMLVGVGLYGVKVLGAPSSFSMLDEFLHWATLDDIVVSGRLFTPNNILLASPYYPGLEIASDLLVRTGFSTWEAGTIVVGVARLLDGSVSVRVYPALVPRGHRLAVGSHSLIGWVTANRKPRCRRPSWSSNWPAPCTSRMGLASFTAT